MRKKSTIFTCFMLLIAATGLTIVGCQGCSNSNSDSGRKKFRVATLVWVGYAPLYLAKEKGFFRDEGIEVELLKIDDTAARRSALLGGSVDGSVDIVDSFTIAAAAGISAKVVLKLDDSVGGDGIVVRKEINSIKDLKGKKIAYPRGLPSHFFLIALLDEAGMTIDDIDTVPMEAGLAGAAFISGSVDAAVTWEPWLSRASKLPNGKILATSREKPDLIVDIFTVRRDYLEENPEVVKAFARAWFRAIEYWKNNKDEANEIMARALKLKKEDFEDMVAGVRYADRTSNEDFFTKGEDGSSKFTKLSERASRIWQREGLMKKPVDAAKFDGSSIVLGDKQ